MIDNFSETTAESAQTDERQQRRTLVEQLQTTGIAEQFEVKGKPVQITFKVTNQGDVLISADDASENIGNIVVHIEGAKANINSKRLKDKYQKVGIMSKAQSLLAEYLIDHGVGLITGTIQEWNTASLHSRYLIRALYRGGYYLTTARLVTNGAKKEYVVTTSLSRTTSDPESAYRSVVGLPAVKAIKPRIR